MRPESKKRIDTQPTQAPLSGLANAMSGLSLSTATPVDPVPAAPPAKAAWKPGRVILHRERAHRGGKTVIVVDDFATHLPPAFIERTAQQLRAACGCGGTVKDRRIEIQGDQTTKIRAVLEAEGFTVGGVK